MGPLFNQILTSINNSMNGLRFGDAQLSATPIQAFELEPRILYSAGPIPIELIADASVDSLGYGLDTDFGFHESLQFESPEAIFEPIVSQVVVDLESNHDVQILSDLQSPSLFEASPTTSLELVFVDQGVDQWQTLVHDIESQVAMGASLKVVILDSEQNGIEQISEALETHTQVSAIHLVSHGNSDQLQIGSTTLTSNSVSGYAGEIASWASSLDEGADFLIYGCDLAATDSGRILLNSLSALCDCDVGASIDATGHAEFDADWELEFAIGAIDTEVVFSSRIQSGWESRLNTFVVTNVLDDGSIGSLRWAVNSANANSGLDEIHFNISGAGVHTISLTSQLTITDAVILDGSTQSGYVAGSPVIELDGRATSGGSDDILRLESGGSTIRGFAIFGASDDAIDIDTGDSNTIVGNFIGLDASGVNAIANGDNGIVIKSNSNVIGGSTIADRNVIAASDAGIRFNESGNNGGFFPPNNNTIIGNYIGTDKFGADGGFGNDIGIEVRSDSFNNTIGTISPGDGNLIAYNNNDGVRVSDDGDGNSIRGNLIYDNGSSNSHLPIDLGGSGVTDNDYTTPIADSDVGANRLQNFPDLISADFDGNDLTITGAVSGRDNINYLVDFYSSPSGNSVGHGDATRYLGTITVLTDSSGHASFTAILSSISVAVGEQVTATATHSDGSTSEFSMNVAATHSNSAPLLDDSGDLLLDPIFKNSFFNTGDSVADILASAGSNPIMDANGDPEGVAVYGVDDSEGTWQFSTDNGTNWTAFSSVVPGLSMNAAVVLDTSARIRFVPSPAFTGAAGDISFSAWDQSDGFASGTTGVDITLRGGSTAFSSVTETATIIVGANFAGVDDSVALTENENPINFNVLENDVLQNVATAVEPLLNFDANEDNDNDGVWQEALNTAGYDLTLNSGASYDAGVTGLPHGFAGAYDLNGVGATNTTPLQSLGSGDPTRSDATFEFWIKPDDAVGQELIWETGDGFIGTNLKLNNGDLEFHTNYFIPFVANTSAFTTADVSGLIAAGEFIHVVGAIDFRSSMEMSLYINGSLVDFDSNAAINDWAGVLDGTGLGIVEGSSVSLASPGFDPFDGQIAAYRFYGSNLNASQVADNYEAAFLTVASHDSFSARGASVSVSATGDVDYDAGALFDYLQSGETTTDSFSYVVSNSDGDLSTANVTITISGENDTPTISTQLFSVNENSTDGTVVGNVVAVDPDGGPEGDLTFALLGGSGSGAFAIDTNGQIVVADSSLLDFETRSTFSLDVTVADGGTPSLDAMATMMVDLVDVNEAPSVSLSNVVLALDEGVDTSNSIRVADIGIADDALGLNTLTLSGADAALFQIVGAELHLRAGVMLDHETAATLDVFVEVDDTAFSGSPDDSDNYTLSVTDVDENPIVSNPLGVLNFDEDATTFVIDLNDVFSDNDLPSLQYSLRGNSNDQLLNVAIANGELTIDFLEDQFGIASVVVRAFDGTAFVEDTAIINVNPINDAPLLASGGVLEGTFSDNASPVGESISNLVDSGVSDIDLTDGLAGVAIIRNDAAPSQGEWEYSTDGMTWHPVSSVNDSAGSLVLSADTRVRFLAANGFVGTTGIEFRALDTSYVGLFTSGGLRQTFDTSPFGDSTPTSASSAFIQTSIVDSSGVRVSRLEVQTDELGASDSFEVSLAAQPTSTVRVSFGSSDITEGTLSNNTFVFGPGNWNVPQTVTVVGQSDGLDDGNRTFQINVASVTSADPRFNGISGPTVTVINNDFVAPAPSVVVETPSETEESESEVVENVLAPAPTPETADTAPQRRIVSTSTMIVNAFSVTSIEDRSVNPDTTNRVQANPSTWTTEAVTAEAVSVFEFQAPGQEMVTQSEIMLSDQLWTGLDDLKENMDMAGDVPSIAVGKIATMASALTVGYVTWLIRGGQILMGVLAHMPAWRLIDPLPILAALDGDIDENEDDSLESMVDKAEKQADSTKTVMY